MKYTLLAIIVACVVLFIASGCAVYYPTSYRAFIPKQWDSEYKEYERLCRENIGKVVYAREIKLTENTEALLLYPMYIKIGEFIEIELMGITTIINKDDNTKRISYLYIGGFTYYTGWTHKSFSMHGDSKRYFECSPRLYGKTWNEEYDIIKKIALDNKESIGGDEILEEYDIVGSLGYIGYQKYFSQIFKKAVYTKSPHYLGNKESK